MVYAASRHARQKKCRLRPERAFVREYGLRFPPFLPLPAAYRSRPAAQSVE